MTDDVPTGPAATVEGEPRAHAPSATFQRERRALAAAGSPSGVAPVGTVLADAELLDPLGTVTTLYATTASSPAVLVFYRGAWCPYCNVALAQYQRELLPLLTERFVDLIAISPQLPDGSLTMQQKHGLDYRVLSDPGNVLGHALGIVLEPAAETLRAQLALGLDLRAVNADHSVGLPMPTAVILDTQHVVRWIDVQQDYSVRTTPAEIITAVEQTGV